MINLISKDISVTTDIFHAIRLLVISGNSEHKQNAKRPNQTIIMHRHNQIPAPRITFTYNATATQINCDKLVSQNISITSSNLSK